MIWIASVLLGAAAALLVLAHRPPDPRPANWEPPERYSPAEIRRIEAALSEALEQLLLLLSAGLTLPQAWRSIAQERGDLLWRREVGFVNRQLEVGVPLAAALVRLKQRCPGPLMQHFCTSVEVSEALGVPVADTLREQVDTWRKLSWERQEERFNRIPLLLSLSSFLFFPLLFTVTLVPGVLRFVSQVW